LSVFHSSLQFFISPLAAMTGWIDACSRGDVEVVRVQIRWRTPRAIRRGFLRAIEWGDHVSVVRVILPHIDWDTLMVAIDVAACQGRSGVLREVLLPRVNQETSNLFMYLAKRYLCLTVREGHLNVFDALADTTYWRDPSMTELAIYIVSNCHKQQRQHTLALLACIAKFRDDKAVSDPTSRSARPIQWHDVAKFATHVDTFLFMEARAAADGVPFQVSSWCNALTREASRSPTRSYKLLPLIHLFTQRIKTGRSSSYEEDTRVLNLESVLTSLLGSILRPPIDDDDGTFLDVLDAIYHMCTVFGFERWWTRWTVDRLLFSSTTYIIELAFHAGKLTRAHVLGSSQEVVHVEIIIAEIDAFQAQQNAIRVELDQAAHLPRVLDDIVMTY
jgi:hypothetical protein